MATSKVFYRSPHNYDLDLASHEAAEANGPPGESLTVQSQSEDADINMIVRRMTSTGQMPTTARVPEYGDFESVGDYRSALHAVMEAQDNFMQLPAKVRAQFSNDPQEFLTFASDPANIDELRKMGLAKEKVDVHDKGSVGSVDQKVGGPESKAGGEAGPAK